MIFNVMVNNKGKYGNLSFNFLSYYALLLQGSLEISGFSVAKIVWCALYTRHNFFKIFPIKKGVSIIHGCVLYR